MADGGGGGGGAFDSFQNFIDQVARPVGETTLTFGLNQTEEGKKWKKDADNMVAGMTGETARTAAEAEGKKARNEQTRREAQMNDQAMKGEAQAKFSTSRNRQKALAGNGRTSTILTSPLGGASSSATNSGKTLLGS